MCTVVIKILLTFNYLISFSGGYVGEHEAGQRLFQVAHDPRCSKSGVYWSWNGGPREGRGAEAIEKGGQISGGGGAGGGWDSIFENDQSGKVLDVDTAINLFKYSSEITGAEWPDLKAVTSPCPTLKVIGAVTKGMVKREELKRMREMGRPGIEEAIKMSRRKKIVATADRVVAGTMSNTVGRVARFFGRRVLGEIPETAKTGSFDEKSTTSTTTDIREMEDDTKDLLDEVAQQLDVTVDHEDEALFEQIYQADTSTTIDTRKNTTVASTTVGV